jgi:DNA ligase 1
VSLFVDLVSTSAGIGATSARRAKVRVLADYLRTLEPDEIETAVHYLSGTVSQGRTGIGYALLQAADPAKAAPHATLALADVDQAIGALGAIRGAGSGARRSAVLRELLARATPAEQAFLERLLTEALRQGALEGVMIDAIAAAAQLPAAAVRRAAMYSKSLGTVARVALLEGARGLEQRMQLEVFAPVSPMLAQTAADVAEALQVLQAEVAFEWKMDGARIQVHKRGEELRVYTRNLNEVTSAVPEVIEAARAFPEDTLILDGEVIAFDAAGRPHPFQITMRRFGRKLGVAQLRADLPLRAYFFDCLRHGSRNLVNESTTERYAALAASVPAAMQMPRLITSSPPAAQAFYEAALAAGHEGVMAKSLTAPYEAGNRGASWLKIKRAHTLDLVVLAAEWGHGRRTGKLSNLHLGALDPASGTYVMLGKTFKGLTDAMLEWQTKQLLAREDHRDAGTVYVRPELVVEIAFSDLQASSRYPGGLALRLARVKRYRDDKGPADTDTIEAVRRLFAAQSGTAQT